MAKNDWRSFTFFDLRSDADKGQLAVALQDARITSTTSGNNRIVVCDSVGRIHFFNSNWMVTNTFRAHAGPITLCELCESSAHLITIGIEEDGLSPTLKCWNLAKPTADGSFPCVRTTKLVIGPVSLSVADNGQCMAVGYAHGLIQLFRGDVKSSRPKEAEKLKCGTGTILGMAFKLAHKTLQLFVCSETTVAVFVLPDRAKEALVWLDRDCRSNRCSVMQQQYQTLGGGTMAERHFMVGQDDAVYCYNSDGRGPCYALDGVKLSVHWFRSHLLTVSKTEHSQNLTVIDVQNNVIGYEAVIADVAGVLIEFGTCYILTEDKQVLHLDERDIRTKLNLLFKQSLYDIGVRIAKNNQYGDEGLAEIFKKYGDHLGQRGKHQEAVEQYLKTIGHLEPSYVIRMFLDPRHIEHLVEYLKALHDRGAATANHTTLLLNCFTRLNKSDQLQDFLHVTSVAASATGDDTFDVDVAIRVCRSTAPDVALQMARQHGKHAAYLAIVVEDKEAFVDALAYMRRLPFDDCEAAARKFGPVLMEHCADEMTQLLMKLCTFYAPASDDGVGAGLMDNGLGGAESIDIMRQLNDAAASHSDEPLEQATVLRADAVSLLHLFVKRPDRMVEFLEHLLANLSKLPPTIYNTLLELYVSRVREDASLADKIMDILRNHEQSCDFKQALVLCRMYEFWPGVLYIYEAQQQHHLVVRHHQKSRHYDELLEFCTRLGAEKPDIWFQALNGLKTDSKCPTQLMAKILQKIAHGKHRSPLQVLNCLAVENGPTLDTVRDYFQQVFGKEYNQIRKEEETAKSYGTSAAAHRQEIQALTREPVEFRGALCLVCRQQLTMPAVYFLCKDSFHEDCLQRGTDLEGKCPVCCNKPETQKLASAQRSQAESRDRHGEFHDLLHKSQDPFGLVAKYFDRGLFNQLVILDEIESMDINRNHHQDSPPKSVAAAAPKPTNVPIVYGAGAEAKMRAHEAQFLRQDEAIKRLPLSEGKMRQQESGGVKPKENKVSPQAAFRAPHKQPPPAVAAASGVAIVNKNGGKASGGSRPAPVTVDRAYDPAMNPFYDPSMNPFGDETDGDVTPSSGSLAKEATTLNPFGEFDEAADEQKPLDSNLNPFE